jgi:hypothetical protein
MICLEEITVIDAPIERCFDLSRSVEVHLIANIHSGEQALAIGGITQASPNSLSRSPGAPNTLASGRILVARWRERNFTG